jgi:CPA2 family monovalent cation:H+ antiporter-2
MELLFFKDILIIFIVSIFVLLLGHRLYIPPIVSFLLTGVLIGPEGLGLIQRTTDVETFAEIGIILLLFGIGMEFSFKKLIQMKRQFLLGGTLQVGLTILAGLMLGRLFNRPWGESFFLGCLLAMSSTAIVLRLLEQKGETTSPQGRLSISILIFQDMVAIPIILLTPLLAMKEGAPFDYEFLWLLAKGMVILLVVFFSAGRIVPRILLLVTRTRSKELFLLTVLGLCFGVAGLASSIGLSLTIGAFLAGLIISESEYSSEAIGHIFPFQALFISIFFVSVGMLLNIEFVLQQPFTILFLTLGILILKTVTAGLTTVILGMPIRIAILTGVLLSQIGEFSFVLAQTGLSNGLGSDYLYQLFLAVALLTMAINPILVNFSPQFSQWVTTLPWPDQLKVGRYSNSNKLENHLENHVMIIGFGVSGKNLARSCKLAGIRYIILEMNPDTVQEQRRLGEPILFGDATHLNVLEHLNIYQAQAIAILVSDPLAARRIVKLAREANPTLYIIVRTRYVQEMSLMIKLGADEAIPDEFGTSIEVFTRVLKQYHIPSEEIDHFIDEIRADGYDLLRNEHKLPTMLSDIKMSLYNVEMRSFRIHESSFLVGKSLSEAGFRKIYGSTVLLIKRGDKLLTNPSPDSLLLANDILVLVGEKLSNEQIQSLFGPVTSRLSETIQL